MRSRLGASNRRVQIMFARFISPPSSPIVFLQNRIRNESSGNIFAAALRYCSRTCCARTGDGGVFAKTSRGEQGTEVCSRGSAWERETFS